MEMVRMSEAYRDIADKAVSMLSALIVMSIKAIDTDDKLLMTTSTILAAEDAKKLIDELKELDAQRDSIMDLAESIGVSCDA